MEYSFTCYGHKNITARHKTTLEFTKDDEVSLEGDCIIGVNADFSLPKLKEFIKSSGSNKIIITIKPIEFNKKKAYQNIAETINAEINLNFDSDKEIVIRKTDFLSKRTFAIKSDKAAFEMDKRLIGLLGQENSKIKVVVQKRA